jgi:hypothetical protein
VLKSPPCMRQDLASSLAPKRVRIPLANHSRVNSALPPHPQSYDELHIHPKTAAGVVGERQRAMQTDVCVYCVGVLHKYKHTPRLTGLLNFPSLNAITIFAV